MGANRADDLVVGTGHIRAIVVAGGGKNNMDLSRMEVPNETRDRQQTRRCSSRPRPTAPPTPKSIGTSRYIFKKGGQQWYILRNELFQGKTDVSISLYIANSHLIRLAADEILLESEVGASELESPSGSVRVLTRRLRNTEDFLADVYIALHFLPPSAHPFGAVGGKESDGRKNPDQSQRYHPLAMRKVWKS